MARPPCRGCSAGGIQFAGKRDPGPQFVALFIFGLLSAPFTFVFATPAYIAICAALVLTDDIACRMGMENLGACIMPAVLFRVRPPRLLSRHRGHGRPHTDHCHCVGPAPLCRGLAAAVPRSLDMQRSTAAAVHQRSRRVAAHCGAVRGGAGHHHTPRATCAPPPGL